MSIDAFPKTVTLKDGRQVVLRLLERTDADALRSFFLKLPEEDRIFLRHDVCNPDLVRQWTDQIDFGRVVPLVAVDGDRIVGDGTLHIAAHGWTQHVAHIRLVTARSHRGLGLGGMMARELVALAADRDLEKLQADVIEDNVGAVRMFERLGFSNAAVLKDMVKDRGGHKRNLAIMVSDVANLNRVLEDWIQESMIPAYRVPNAGV